MGRGSTLAFNLVGDLVYLGEGVAVAIDEVTYLGGGVHDGGVVAAAERLTYLREGLVGELAREIHGDLARIGETLRAALADEVGLRDTEVAADLVLDEFYGDLPVCLVRQDIPEDLFGEVGADLPAVERGVGQDTYEGPFELSDVCGDLRGDKGEHIVVDLEVVHKGFLAQDGDPGLQVGRLDVRHKAPLEATDKTVLQRLDVPGVSV